MASVIPDSPPGLRTAAPVVACVAAAKARLSHLGIGYVPDSFGNIWVRRHIPLGARRLLALRERRRRRAAKEQSSANHCGVKECAREPSCGASSQCCATGHGIWAARGGIVLEAREQLGRK